MFEYRSPVFINLRDTLKQPNCTLEEVLNEESCMLAYKNHYKMLSDYLITKTEDILQLAFADENSELSRKSYSLLTSENDTLIREILETDLLNKESVNILANNQNRVNINRFASVFQALVAIDPVRALTENLFIYKLIPFADERLVLSLFEMIMQDEKVKDARSILLEQDFVKKLLDHISKIPSTLSMNILDETVSSAAGMFKLAKITFDCEAFRDQICSIDAISILAKDFEVAPTFVLNYQWAALSAITNKTVITPLVPKIHKLVDMINIETDPPHFFSYQADIISVISKIVISNASSRTILIERGFPETLVRIIALNPQNTLTHMAISNFVLAVDNILDFEDQVLRVFLPFCENSIISESTPRNVKAFSWHLLSALKKNVDSGKASTALLASLGGLDEGCISSVVELDGLEEAAYGGELPKQEEDDALDFLNGLSPEEIMAFLRLLTNGGGMKR